jgi:RNA polymerase sigma-70 factor (ECF subfamily)
LFVPVFLFFDYQATTGFVATIDEKQLIQALQGDGKSAMQSIFNRYHALLCRVSYRIVNDKDEAQDVVQEVFIKLWRNRKELTITYSLEAYLKRAVVNTSLNLVERKRKFKSLDLDPSHTETLSGEIVNEKHNLDELTVLVDHTINSLPVRTKAVFTLIRYEEMSYKEVAEILHISLKAVEKEMMKALRLLRKGLKDFLPFLLMPLLEGILIF